MNKGFGGEIGFANQFTFVLSHSIHNTNHRKIMNKAELIEQISKDAGLSKVQANSALDAFTGAVMSTLKKGDKVTLVGFGTFSVAQRAARNGRNPQTGETIKIKASKSPKFKAGKEFADKIAGAKAKK